MQEVAYWCPIWVEQSAALTAVLLNKDLELVLSIN
jgi:hypothetical protein